MNVFGNPLTKRAVRELQGIPDDAPEPTCFEVASVALEMIVAEEKLENARAYLRHLEDYYGILFGTKLLIYNATGETMRLINYQSMSGYIVENLPVDIHNGQWGAFFHRGMILPSSMGNVTYRINSTDTELRICWDVVPFIDNICNAEISNNWPTEENHHFEVEIQINNENLSECLAYIMRLYAV